MGSMTDVSGYIDTNSNQSSRTLEHRYFVVAQEGGTQRVPRLHIKTKVGFEYAAIGVANDESIGINHGRTPIKHDMVIRAQYNDV